MIIAIDGPAGAGKSTIARLMAQRLGFLYVDTGAMYRALTLKLLRLGNDFSDKERITEIAGRTNIDLKRGSSGNNLVFLDGNEVTDDIRAPEVTRAVFNIARLPAVRNIMVGLQRKFAETHDIVMEGRDIGTVVFPKAEKKFYLDANSTVRAKRRQIQLEEKGIPTDIEQLKRDIEDRDIKDKTRACGPLKKASDAVYIDTTFLNIEQVVNALMNYLSNEKK